jgi:hypothetical protein
MFQASSQFGPSDDFASTEEPILTFKLVNTAIYKARTKFDSSSEGLSEGFLATVAFTDSHSLPTATPMAVASGSGCFFLVLRFASCEVCCARVSLFEESFDDTHGSKLVVVVSELLPQSLDEMEAPDLKALAVGQWADVKLGTIFFGIS